MTPKFYEANLSIACVDGATIYGCISSEAIMLSDFLAVHDHEGSNLHLAIRDTPEQDPFREIFDNEAVYNQIQGWLND